MPANFFGLPSAVTLSTLFSAAHPFGARNLALVFVALFLGGLGLTMWVGHLRGRRRSARHDPR